MRGVAFSLAIERRRLIVIVRVGAASGGGFVVRPRIGPVVRLVVLVMLSRRCHAPTARGLPPATC